MAPGRAAARPRAQRVAQLDAQEHGGRVADRALGEARDLDLAPRVLERLEAAPVVEQVVGAAAVDLEERDGDLRGAANLSA